MARPIPREPPVTSTGRSGRRRRRRAHADHRTKQEAQARPAPMPTSSTWLPSGMRPRGARVGEGERDRRRRRVAEIGQVDHGPLRRDAEALGGGVDDAGVGLVGHEQVDVVGGRAGELERGGGRGGDRPRRPAEQLGSVHDDVLPTGRDVEDVGATGIAAEVDAEHAGRRGPGGVASGGVVRGERADHDGAGPVAEQHRRRAVVGVDERREAVGADDEHALDRRAGRQERPHVEGVDEARAGGVEVERGAAGAQRLGDA